MRRPTDSSGWLDTTPRLCHGRAHSGPRSHAALRRKRRAAAARAYHHRLARCRGNRELRANATSDRGRGWYIALINVFTAVTFAIVPLLHRFGGLVAPLTFIGTAYVAIFAIGWDVGTDAGAQFFFLVAAALVVLLVGIEHTALAVGLAAVAAGLVIALEFLVPPDTGLQPPWAMSVSFVLTTVSACGVAVATVWFALRDTARAEAVMEAEHDRSEALLANMLPASIAERLKEPERNIIADKYDEASVLFADIVGFTERASSTAPADLVRFLDRLYSAFDELVDQHGLEKIKVSGDSYSEIASSFAIRKASQTLG